MRPKPPGESPGIWGRTYIPVLLAEFWRVCANCVSPVSGWLGKLDRDIQTLPGSATRP